MKNEQSAPKRRAGGTTPTEAQHAERGNGRMMLRMPLATIAEIKSEARDRKCSVTRLVQDLFFEAVILPQSKLGR